MKYVVEFLGNAIKAQPGELLIHFVFYSITQAVSSAGDQPSTLAFLNGINRYTLPDEYKQEGKNWFAVFNPKVVPALDIDLLGTFVYER